MLHEACDPTQLTSSSKSLNSSLSCTFVSFKEQEDLGARCSTYGKYKEELEPNADCWGVHA